MLLITILTLSPSPAADFGSYGSKAPGWSVHMVHHKLAPPVLVLVSWLTAFQSPWTKRLMPEPLSLAKPLCLPVSYRLASANSYTGEVELLRDQILRPGH